MRNFFRTNGLYKIAFLIAMLLCTGCSGFNKYVKDRALDLTDIVDIKAGLCFVGAGAKIEATDYVAVGLGFGLAEPTIEFFGRFSDQYAPIFIYFGVAGAEGSPCSAPISDHYVLFYHRTVLGWDRESRIPLHMRFRFGGEFVIPIIAFGAYLNMGELADFVLGFGGLDIANDDGYEKGSSLNDYVRENKEPIIAKEPLEYIYSGDEEERAEAARILGKHKLEKAVPSLIYALEHDSSDWVKRRARNALEEISGKEYGMNIEAWKEWWETEKEKRSYLE